MKYALLIELPDEALHDDSIDNVAVIVNEALAEQRKITRRSFWITARPLSEELAC